MKPEKSLDSLMRGMSPHLHEGPFAFCSWPDDAPVPHDAVAVFREPEGTTVVVSRGRADTLWLRPSYVAAWITLTVHSELDGIGLLASVTSHLAGLGISCNVFSALHHDHLFVPFEKGKEALEALRHLSAEAASNPV